VKKIVPNKLIIAFVLFFVTGTLFIGCGSGGGAAETAVTDIEVADVDVEAEDEAEAVDEAVEEGMDTIVVITMQNGGVIEVELDSEAAPITVANFLNLVDEGFYDNLTFHRIILGFMIQGGDPDGTGSGGLNDKIKGEFAKNGWDNPISHKRGVISMARTNDPDSASCQFFITNVDAIFLDGQYAAFGHVISGMEVVDEISAVSTDENDRPDTPVVIESIRRK